MFNLSFNDRLKAAVNQLDAVGTNLQARAIGQNHKDGRPTSPNVSTKQYSASSSPMASPSVDRGSKVPNPPQEVSPTRSNSVTTNALAENALAGLRKSFNFASRERGSIDAGKPSVASPNGPQELKDIAHIQPPSRSGSPARFLNPATFALGSDPSSSTATPQQPRSPRPDIPLIQSPKTQENEKLPQPDPSDPATYPLPPSPPSDLTPLPSASTALLSATSATLSAVSSSRYADPLGASPLLDADKDEAAEPPPALDLQTPPPNVEDGSNLEGSGVNVMETDRNVDVAETEGLVSEQSTEPIIENGDDESENVTVVKEESDDKQDVDNAKKLEAAERRYEDLSQRFTGLLTQKHNADQILRDLTPLEGGIQDHEAFEGWVRMVTSKVEMITTEMTRLQSQITLQGSRMEELRDTHRLEGASQVELIAKLRSQISTAESKLTTNANDLVTLAQLRGDLQKAQGQAKDEEEKRTKAISLLKTVRQKLVKAEKDKEDSEKDRAEERAQRSQAVEEVERVKAEREREVNGLRKGFERELAGAKERFEKDLSAKKAAWELEMITTKASHAKDISAKSTKVNGLEGIVKELSLTKSDQFEELQAKQAEMESYRSETEALQTRTKELEFQLRETTERCLMLEDSSNPGRTLGAGPSSPSPSLSRQNSGNSTSPVDVKRLLAEAEARSEARVSDLRFKIRSLENERNEAEEEWAVKLQERVRELEKLRRMVQEKESEFAESLRTRQEKEARIKEEEDLKRGLERQIKVLKATLEEAKGETMAAGDVEKSAREEVSSLHIQISTLQTQLDDAKSHSTQLRTTNKTLREEMRKIQSSVQLMERSRNPGVGYWSSIGTSPSTGPSKSGLMSPEPVTPTVDSRNSLESARDSVRTGTGTGTGNGTGAKSSPAASVSEKDKDEEEVNLEYLRNVILQFLEHKEMRPNLIRVLSVILRFTPQELRRLNAKLMA